MITLFVMRSETHAEAEANAFWVHGVAVQGDLSWVVFSPSFEVPLLLRVRIVVYGSSNLIIFRSCW